MSKIIHQKVITEHTSLYAAMLSAEETSLFTIAI